MAKLPNADRAVVDDRKMVGYLLNDAHRVGGPKSAFFKSFGFSSDEPDVLAIALRAHAVAYDVKLQSVVPSGDKYEISGPLPSPDGRMPVVKSVWMTRVNETFPRFVTAVPD